MLIPGRPIRRVACWNRGIGRCWTRCAAGRECGAISTARGRDVTAGTTPDMPRPTDDIVDVLIIGAGASGAAVAWSLAETRMKILCLEQGDWIKPTDFPSNSRDWEARRYADFDISPNRRARDTDYPVNDDNSPMKIANFNGVGGGTILFTAHYPRMHPSDFRVRALDGIADDWPIDYWTLEPFFSENDRMTQTRRLAAIMAADVAGYSRLIGADEQGTLNRLRSIRTEVVDPKINEHHGRLVK